MGRITPFFLCCILVLGSFFTMGASCVKSPDGKSYNFRMDGTTLYNALTGKGNQWDTPGKGSISAQMTLGEFIKEAMTPTGLTQEQKLARAKELNNKKITIILPQNLGTATGEYLAEYSSYFDQKLKTWVQSAYTGNVAISCEPPEKYWSEPIDYPDEAFIKSISSTPGMKITKLLQYMGSKREHFYYRLECVDREPVVLSFDDWFFRELALDYNLPTTKKALQKALTN